MNNYENNITYEKFFKSSSIFYDTDNNKITIDYDPKSFQFMIENRTFDESIERIKHGISECIKKSISNIGA